METGLWNGKRPPQSREGCAEPESELPAGTVLTELHCRQLKPGCNCSTVLYLPRQGPWFGAGHGFVTGEWTGQLLPHPSPSRTELGTHEATQPRETAGKPHLGIVIILGSGITLGMFPVPWGSAGCLRAREGGVPRPASSHGPGSKQGRCCVSTCSRCNFIIELH